MTKKQDDDRPVLNESEQRLNHALDRLKNAVGIAQTNARKVQALEAERDTLKSGLGNLKTDYVALEEAFNVLKSQYDEARVTHTGDEEGVTSAIRGRENAERELAIVKAEYETLDRSFGLLKSRYVALQELNEGDGFSTPGGDDSGEIRMERDRLQDELDRLKQDYQVQSEALAHIRGEYDGLKKVRIEVSERLDHTISELERLTLH